MTYSFIIPNQEKHEISFEDAIDVFNDKDRINYRSDRNGEQRFKTIGKAFQAIISVIYTTRDLVIRIISARRARKEERRAYLTKKLSKQDDDK
ncbi:MAG: BrnT family toxin [Lewinellaceae bacterium]|nr:BrnT family toxin [Lewinellaceae bacterium]